MAVLNFPALNQLYNHQSLKPQKSLFWVNVLDLAKKTLVKDFSDPVLLVPQSLRPLGTPQLPPVETYQEWPLPLPTVMDFVEVMEGRMTPKQLLQRVSGREKNLFCLLQAVQWKLTRKTWIVTNWGNTYEPNLLRQVSVLTSSPDSVLIELKTEEDWLDNFHEQWNQMVQTIYNKPFKPIVGSFTGRITSHHPGVQVMPWKSPPPGTGGISLGSRLMSESSMKRIFSKIKRPGDGIGLKPLATPSKQHYKLLQKVSSMPYFKKIAQALKQLTLEEVFDLLPSHVNFVSAKCRRRDALKDALEAGLKAQKDQIQWERNFRRRYERASWYSE